MAKQHYLFLERFNNYFNRKIIKYDTLNDYITHSRDNFCPLSEGQVPTFFDFNPNDNITTEVICNDVPFDPDYILIFDDDVDETIASRWFIVEQKRNRQGQWIYYLKRDVIADNLDSLLTAPIFVEKGMLNEDDPFIVNDEGMNLNQIKRAEYPIIDKSRTAWIIGYMARNIGGSDISIQVDEESANIDYITISDIASAMGTTEGVLSGLLNFNFDTSNKAQFTQSIGMTFSILRNLGLNDFMNVYNATFPYDMESFTNSYKNNQYDIHWLFRAIKTPTSKGQTAFARAVVEKRNLWQQQLKNMLGKSYYLDGSQLDILRTFVGKTVRYNGKFYTLSISDTGQKTEKVNNIKNDGNYSALTQTLERAVELSEGELEIESYDPAHPKRYVLNEIRLENFSIAITLNYISDYDKLPQLNTQISSGRKTTADQEFDIFAIPLSLTVVDNGDEHQILEAYSRRIASAISLNENAKVYDLQLLPYCPIPNLISYDNEIDITNLTEHKDYDLVTKNTSDTYTAYLYKNNMTFTPAGDGVWTATGTVTMSVPAGKTPTLIEVAPQVNGGTVTNLSYSVAGNDVSISFTWTGDDPSDYFTTITMYCYYYYTPETSISSIIFYVQKSTFSTSIPVDSNFFGLVPSGSKKVISNCRMWRLVSPNYQGSFEFNIAKNGGDITSFNVFCTYKPFTPTIKVAPNFNWLYGGEFADNRGLLCGGDFSLPRVTDEWITYQLNNKNYQNIFNRDIQHLDYMQGLEMRNQLVSGAVGIFSDAAKGAAAGGMAGGGWGAVAGAVIGAGTSAIGYGIDVDTMAKTHRENKQLAIDKFNYQLGNIKALPYTLTKVGSFDVISKIFPFVEAYSCTSEEEEAFENKIKYESMTVMRIGTLEQFKDFDSELHYFKGSLIRNDEISDDSHVLNAIYEELLKGVYI